jgi:P-aminobenzoate N-oxygenase AurF
VCEEAPVSESERFETDCLMQSVFRDHYALDAERLESLYSKSKRHQWNAELDVDWAAFEPEVQILDAERDFLSRLRCVQELPEAQRDALLREAAIFAISQILHGEQAALMVCGQLVNVVPDLDGKFAAAVQVMDEARHVEVFSRYLAKVGHRYPIDPDLQAIVGQILAERDWEAKCVGMQVILESVALGFFRSGTELAREPVFASFIGRVHEDESRHVAYGVLSLAERIPKLAPDARRRLEDLAYESVFRIAGRGGRPTFTTQFRALPRAGIDAGSFLPRVLQEVTSPEGLDLEGVEDPFTETVIPNLMRVGLVPERHRLGYLAQGWRLDLRAGTVEDLHTWHPDTRGARAELAAAGRSVTQPG